jgi:hypothetical protein
MKSTVFWGEKKNRNYAASLKYAVNFLATQIYEIDFYGCFFTSAYANVGGCLKVNITMCRLWCHPHGVLECEKNKLPGVKKFNNSSHPTK